LREEAWIPRAAEEDRSMTKKRDLKRRVRARQARTGESYVTALRRVSARRSAVPVVEFLDVTKAGAALGMKCRVAMFPALADRVDPAALLARVREVLAASEEDLSAQLMRAVVLGCKPHRLEVRREAPPEVVLVNDLDELIEMIGQPGRLVPVGMEREFLTRARAGVGGWSRTGQFLALPVAIRQKLEMVILFLSGTARGALIGDPSALEIAARKPSLVLTPLDSLASDAFGLRV
jgi:hypothetical protein